MARNVYFSTGPKNEQSLYEDIIIEALAIYGHDIYYIPRRILELNKVINEDVISSFNSAFKIEAYVESIDGFEGDGKILSKFGLEVRDQVTLVVSRRRWNSLIGRYGETEGSIRPREGDLVYYPVNKYLFEIKFVEDKKPFFQLDNVPTFKLICELFEYENQNIDTGISDIDILQAKNSQTHRVYVTFPIPTSRHIINEYLKIELPDGALGSAKLLSYKKEGDNLVISLSALTFDDGQFHELIADTILTGLTTNSVSHVVDVIDLTSGDEELFENDYTARNSTFETVGNDYLDFTEANPFGEP